MILRSGLNLERREMEKPMALVVDMFPQDLIDRARKRLLQFTEIDTSKRIDLLPEEELPDWFSYPKPYLWTVDQGIQNLGSWNLMTREGVQIPLQGLRKRYPNRQLFPFATRKGNDDVACWEKGNLKKVTIIHDFASPGWEQRETYEDFWDWLKTAVTELEKLPDQDLRDIF